jgi:ABC-2 type transport system ATP-binding protein
MNTRMNYKHDYAVECEDLTRVYTSRNTLGTKRQTAALDGLNLTIPKGVVFGVLGPNGAGKTTLVRILSTLLTPTSGWARVAGFDVVRQAGEVRKRIGQVLGGDRGYYGRLSGRENLLYFAALNHLNPSLAAKRVDEMLNRVAMTDAADNRMERYSRGMKQRIHIARGLLMDPDILFLDEPTMGLDPFGAQDVRQLVPELASQGKTIVLTTHYMFEADTLCQTVAMINHGKLMALGTPAEIKGRFARISIVEVTVKKASRELADQLAGLDGVQRVDMGADGALHKLSVHCAIGLDLRDRICEVIGRESVENVTAREPTLEEAYLNILK